jgi:hypothetical protein
MIVLLKLMKHLYIESYDYLDYIWKITSKAIHIHSTYHHLYLFTYFSRSLINH